MNYRHVYHAGNFADVFKHATLALMVESLKRKDQPFVVIDTHAGTGCYDLHGTAPGKTGEYLNGIAKLLDGPPLALTEPYLSAVRAVNPGGGLRLYPGSPRVARHLLRPQDRLALVELHPEDAGLLRREFANDPQVGVHHRDAYDALIALVPPKERRGLVLIDPPFEVKNEFDCILRGLTHALKRWPTGTYGVWYPIKGREPVAAFHKRLAALEGVKSLLTAELMIHPTDTLFRLNGCGLALIQPPWQLDETLRALMPDLLHRLGHDPAGARLEWLVAS